MKGETTLTTAMHLVLALDQGFETLASVALTSFLLHHSFESVVVVAPEGHPMERLSALAAAFHVPLRLQPIPADSALSSLPPAVRPYFFCIEALKQDTPGRYLYVDADTLCVNELSALEDLPLDDVHPLAACSHGRPMPDRSLVLALESPYHYFNAGVLLFDSAALAKQLSPVAVVDYFLRHRALCRFREQCALNGILRGKVRYLPGQYNLLSWMRERQDQGRWHNLAANPMAYCLTNVREQMAIVHLSAGALPTQVEESRREPMDCYWLLLEKAMDQPEQAPNLPRYAERW